MTNDKLKELLEKTDLPVSYYEFDEDTIEPPFLCYYEMDSKNFAADGIVYTEIKRFAAELYTDDKNTEIEKRVEAVLDGAEIFWNKEESRIEEESMYEVIYKMEV